LAVGEAEGHHYFAMEFVDGANLNAIIEKEGRVPLWRAVPLFIDVAKGLAHAHARDLIHRDIKPDNIMLTRDGVPKVADLGLAKETTADRSAITESGTALGTAYYMPPEQARDAKRADQRSDVYALGATFYHAVTGRVPFEGDSFVEVTSKHESDPLTPPRKLNPEVPERLSMIIEKMMGKKREYRFKSMGEVVDALEAVHVPRPRARRAPTREKPRLEPARPQPGRKRAPRQLWYAEVAGPGGKLTTREFDLPTLQRHVEAGRLPLDAPVRQGKTGVFRTMDRYPQLARALRMRRAKDRDHMGRRQPYRELYEEYDRRLARRALIRRIKAVLRWVVILGLVGAAAWAVVTYLLPLVRG
jgi:serine/threonine protein kinase